MANEKFRKLRSLLTLQTKLDHIPPAWIKRIEPNIIRGSFLPCWLWDGTCDRNGNPMMRVEGKLVSVRRFVAQMFWEFPDEYFALVSCKHQNCINPAHILIKETTR